MDIVPGILNVNAICASQLKNSARIGKQSPYCKFIIGGKKEKTPVDKGGGKNPQWNQQFRFVVPPTLGGQFLFVEVKVKKALGSSVLLGSGKIKASNVPHSSVKIDIPIYDGNGNSTGTVETFMNFEPTNNGAADAVNNFRPAVAPVKPPRRASNPTIHRQLSDLGQNLASFTVENSTPTELLNFSQQQQQQQQQEEEASQVLDLRKPSAAENNNLLDLRNRGPSTAPTPSPAPSMAPSMAPSSSPPAAVTAVHQSNLSELISMGFSPSAASSALAQSSDILRDAVNLLLSSPASPPPVPRSRVASNTPRVVYDYSSNPSSPIAPVPIPLKIQTITNAVPVTSNVRSSIPSETKAGRNLKHGWEERRDNKTGRYYYLNHDNQTTSWKHPGWS
ncbi:hypothetical protein TrVE_jg3368 [Triparma verrucosa]|uniref:WW domain-containing protein n=1 Tax=Triparma verrucosa TaxID=1606542 RepID=A0A9W7KXR5_9STRA|nr:hypothetical protein TrVE_jg3368 [Triparma verrucosa]